MASEIAELAEELGPEVPSDAIGVAVLERLRPLDPVSYLRFASVYKGFDDLADFEAEVVELQKTTRPKAVQAQAAAKPPEAEQG
jgi:transcriptional repressor NrdR